MSTATVTRIHPDRATGIEPGSVPAADLARACDITGRLLHHWTVSGRLHAVIDGTTVLYTPHEQTVAKRAAIAHKAGLDLGLAFMVARNGSSWVELSDHVAIVITTDEAGDAS